MSANAEVQKMGNETALATIRKFSRRVQGAGLVKTVRNRRYFARDTSKIVKKKRALKLLKRKEEYRQLLKEGKVSEAPQRRGPMQPRTMRESTDTQASSRLPEGAPIAR